MVCVTDPCGFICVTCIRACFTSAAVIAGTYYEQNNIVIQETNFSRLNYTLHNTCANSDHI